MVVDWVCWNQTKGVLWAGGLHNFVHTYLNGQNKTREWSVLRRVRHHRKSQALLIGKLNHQLLWKTVVTYTKLNVLKHMILQLNDLVITQVGNLTSS